MRGISQSLSVPFRPGLEEGLSVMLGWLIAGLAWGCGNLARSKTAIATDIVLCVNSLRINKTFKKEGLYSPILWKLPPPTSPLTIFDFPFVFFNISVPPLTLALDVAALIMSCSSSSSSPPLPSLRASNLGFFPVKAEEISTSSSEKSSSKASGGRSESESEATGACLRLCDTMDMFWVERKPNDGGNGL